MITIKNLKSTLKFRQNLETSSRGTLSAPATARPTIRGAGSIPAAAHFSGWRGTSNLPMTASTFWSRDIYARMILGLAFDWC